MGSLPQSNLANAWLETFPGGENVTSALERASLTIPVAYGRMGSLYVDLARAMTFLGRRSSPTFLLLQTSLPPLARILLRPARSSQTPFEGGRGALGNWPSRWASRGLMPWRGPSARSRLRLEFANDGPKTRMLRAHVCSHPKHPGAVTKRAFPFDAGFAHISESDENGGSVPDRSKEPVGISSRPIRSLARS
jgi:hypothetical protein